MRSNIARFSARILWLAVFVVAAAASALAEPKAPTAKIIPRPDTLFGEVRVDNYFWMREKTNPQVIDYLKSENAYTDSIMAPTEGLQKKLYDEMLGRIKETDLSVPVKRDDYYYYSRTEQGKAYSIYCRKHGSIEAPEEIILDVNDLAKGHDYLGMGGMTVSDDHNLLAFSCDYDGSERMKLQVKDLRTGKILPDSITNTSYSLEWANDNATLFYTTLDSASRAFKLYRHKLGDDPAQDPLIYFEPDEAYSVDVSKTKDKMFLLIELTSTETSEVRFLSATQPTGEFRVVHPREHGVEYSVEHRGSSFYIVTNDHARNFRLMETSQTDPSKPNWKEVIAHRDSVLIDGIDLFKDYLVVYERKGGLKQMRVTDLSTNQSNYVSFPEAVYTYYPGNNPEFNSNRLRFTYTSMTTPRSVYDYNMADQQRELLKKDEVLGGYDPSKYESERLMAPAVDGALVPVSIVYKKGMVRDGKNPLLLMGYGSYGISMEPNFSSARLSLLDRGFIYAVGHIRGGSEMGRLWYDDGKLLRKKNTFNDFIACAEYLVKNGYTSSDRLAIIGGSAGGLLMGAVTNMRPDLFKAVVADVPFVDIINTMLDKSLPSTVTEFEEWGNPTVKEDYDYMKSYSPYDNTSAKNYPVMLIEGGLNDPRVSYWEPAKWTARLRALKTDTHRLLLKTNMGSGHFGASGRYGYLKDIAFEYAFICDALGIRE